MSVTVPVPLAEAFQRLADRGLTDSVSEATTHALEEAFHAVIVGMRLAALHASSKDSASSQSAASLLQHLHRVDTGVARCSAHGSSLRRWVLPSALPQRRHAGEAPAKSAGVTRAELHSG